MGFKSVQGEGDWMDQMNRNQMSREAQFREFLEKASQKIPIQFPQQVIIAPVDAAFFFPWERSPYRTNGSTTSETSGN